MNNAAEYLQLYQAWRRGEDERTMREVGLHPQQIGTAIDEVLAGFRRYEKLRKLNPRQYRELWLKHISGDELFDELVDALT